MYGFFADPIIREKMYKIDLHLHTTASDGSDTPGELIRLAKEAGLTVISITDHDTLAGCIEAVSLPDNGIKIVTGIEFSCHHYGECDFDCHILGYGFDLNSPELLAAIAHGRQMRLMKLDARLKYLDSQFGIRFDEEELAWLRSLNSAARPHLGRLILKHGITDTLSDAMNTYLKGEGFPDDRIGADEAISAILAAGGIPVYAHPLGGEGDARLTKDELIPRVDALAKLGLGGLECYYSRYSEADSGLIEELARERNLLTSAGSDYHGKNKTVELGRLASDRDDVSADASIIPALLNTHTPL